MLEKEVCGTIESVSVGILESVKFKRIRLIDQEGSFVIQCFGEYDEVFNQIEPGKDIYGIIYLYVFDEKLDKIEWLVDEVELM